MYIFIYIYIQYTHIHVNIRDFPGPKHSGKFCPNSVACGPCFCQWSLVPSKLVESKSSFWMPPLLKYKPPLPNVATSWLVMPYHLCLVMTGF